MQDWDRVFMVAFGALVAAHTIYGGWKLWGRRQRKAAVGALLVAAGAVAMPLAFLLLAR